MDEQFNQQQSKHDRSRTRWTASLDKLFVDLVLEQVLQGNRSNNVFSKKAWQHIRDEFNQQTGLEFNTKQLTKHLNVLRTRFNNAKSQFVQSGFGDNESTHMVMNGGAIWDDYIEDYPFAETTRTKDKDSPILDQLSKIFAESSDIGRFAQSSHYIELDKETVAAETPRSVHKATSMHVDPQTPSLVQDYSSSHSDADANLDVQNKRKPSAPSSSRNRKRSRDDFDDAIAEALLEMATASKLRADAVIEYSNRYSITKCVELLDKVQGIDQSLYFDALNLFDNPDHREIFVSLKSEKRLSWLDNKCKVSSVSSE